MTKYNGTRRGFRDSKINGTLQFEEDGNGKLLQCLGTTYIDRKALAD